MSKTLPRSHMTTTEFQTQLLIHSKLWCKTELEMPNLMLWSLMNKISQRKHTTTTELPIQLQQTSELSLKCQETQFLLVIQLAARLPPPPLDGMCLEILHTFLDQMRYTRSYLNNIPFQLAIPLDARPPLNLLAGMFQLCPLRSTVTTENILMPPTTIGLWLLGSE